MVQNLKKSESLKCDKVKLNELGNLIVNETKNGFFLIEW